VRSTPSGWLRSTSSRLVDDGEHRKVVVGRPLDDVGTVLNVGRDRGEDRDAVPTLPSLRPPRTPGPRQPMTVFDPR
jgi:hypothetical protein